MAKKVDDNGFWLLENNPISKVGVFPYYGCEISPELTADKLYYVLRPEEELSSPETIKSFDLVPLINDHEMLGAGYTPAENKGVDGVISQPYYKDGRLLGAYKIFSESMKNDITHGKKELSPGYTCEYELTPGVFNAQNYDAIQRNIRGNHVALVDEGRTGPDNRVYDAKRVIYDHKAIALDANNLKLVTEKGQEEMDKKTTAKDKAAAFKAKIKQAVKDALGADEAIKEDVLEKVADAVIAADAEKEAPETGKDETPDDEEKVEDEAENPDEEEKPAEDEEPDEEEKKAADKKPKTVSADAIARKVMLDMAGREKMVKALEPALGTFDHALMTADEVAIYGAKKLGLDASSATVARAGVNAYLKAWKPEAAYTMATDSAAADKNDGDFADYVKGVK